MPPGSIYLTDSNPRPDSDFLPAELRHLVEGNGGRLLDARRTPIEITGIDGLRGYFEVEIQAFEDKGAHWLVPFENFDRYQFATNSRIAPPETISEYERRVGELNQPMTIEVDLETRERTLEKLRREHSLATRWLGAHHAANELEPSSYIRARLGDARLFELAREYLRQRKLERMDSEFAAIYVSNPHSGEQVKGHAIVLAELGLCRFEGKIIRDRKLFKGEWSKARRAEHLLARLAFTQALWSRIHQPIFLFRGFSAAESPDRRAASFVSATFSKTVAESHHPSSLRQQELPLDRLFMTFLETEAMNHPYQEAEAVLIGGEHLASF